MKNHGTVRFDAAALRELAGGTTFTRGEAYYRDGQVELLAIEPNRVLARVAGTEDYRTVLTGRDTAIGGECSCPAFGDRGTCKHMVAAALAANAAAGEDTAESVGALARIRDHLKSKGADALVEMIVALAERDMALFRRLDLAATAVRSDTRTLEARLRKALDAATRTRGYMEYREAAGWAADVEAALDSVAALVSAGHAAVALRLAARAIDRIGGAVDDIDDSDGDLSLLLDRAAAIHLDAAAAARPEPVAFARDLFAREMGEGYGTFGGAAECYAEVLGAQGLAEYRRLAAEAWDELPARAAGGRGRYEFQDGADYDQLLRTLDFFAERDGDLEARIALRTKDLSSSSHYLRLAQFCLEQGRAEEALRRAEDGLWLFEDERTDERLLLLTVELLLKADRRADAEARLSRAFKKQPSLDLYGRLRAVGGENARDRALDFLQGRLAREPGSQWYSPADLLIRVLMREEMYERAWETVRRHGAPVGTRAALARASEATHSREALATYAERIDLLVGGGGNPAYEEAVGLVGRMAGLREAKEQNDYVMDLKVRFGRKRNFMKLLG